MAKDEYFNLFILITLLLDIASSLYLSKETAVKTVDENFIVVCKDDAGLAVTWKGPKGRLGAKTHPRVQQGSYGTSIVFNKIRIGDTGNYTCTTVGTKTSRIFRLIVEETVVHPTRPNHGHKHPWRKHKDNKTTLESKVSSEINVNIDTNSKENYNASESPIEDFKFTDDSTSQVGVEGEATKLQCKTNLDNVDTSWSLANGEALKGESNEVNGGNGLIIKNVSRGDANTYTCQALHKNTGRIITKNIEFVVHHKPYLVYAQENVVYGFMNEPLNLTCEVEANPPPTIRWARKRNMGTIVEHSSHKSVLQLNMTEDTPGDYTCITFNKIGKLEKIFSVGIGVKPDPPENVTLVEATSTTLEINIQVANFSEDVLDTEMEPTILLIEYRPESKEDTEWVGARLNISEERAIISELEKNTKYEIRVAIENSAGIISDYYDTVFETSLATSIHTKSHILNLLVYLTMFLISKFWLA